MSNIESFKISDTMEIYNISNDGVWTKVLETNNNPTLEQQEQMKSGDYLCAFDAMTNYALNDLASYLLSSYSYISVGTDGTSGTDYSLNALKSQILTRIEAATALVNTYSTDPLLPDTAEWVSIFTSDGDYTIAESGVHSASTGGHMMARQVSCTWSVVSGQTFGVIWKAVCSRA